MDLHIHSYGAYMHVRDSMFEVIVKGEAGDHKRHQFAPKRIRSILLDEGTALSTECISLAMQHHITIHTLQSSGDPIARIWHSRPGSTTAIRKRQLEASMQPEAINHIKQWVCAKLANQCSFLKDLKSRRSGKTADQLQSAVERIVNFSASINALQGDHVDDIADSLRGFEGNAGKTYFAALSSLLPERYAFNGRSSRPAGDVFNAMLNYAYGILYSRVERVVNLAGLDPFCGFLHRDDYNTRSFVFDFIEPFRPFADRAVFQLFSTKKVNDAHSELIPGGVQLVKEGKQLCAAAFHKAFDEDRVRINNRNTTRGLAMQRDAHAFANTLIDLPADVEHELVVIE